MCMPGRKFLVALLTLFTLVHVVWNKPTQASQPSVLLKIQPSETSLSVASPPVAISAEATGTKLSFQWQLVGAGSLEGDLTGYAVHYFPPEQLERKTGLATVSVKVKDYKSQEATASITFTIRSGKGASAKERNSETQDEDQKLFPRSYVQLWIFRNPQAGEEGWQPRPGVKVTTEEGEVGMSGEGFGEAGVSIPVYGKEPLELIKISVGGRSFKVPTFGPKKGIRGELGAIDITPEGKLIISTSTCPEVYEYLKSHYGFDLHPVHRKAGPQPRGECNYPLE